MTDPADIAITSERQDTSQDQHHAPSTPDPIPPPQPPPVAKKTRPLTRVRRNWLAYTWCLTWWIPSFVLSFCCKMARKDVQIAWREKIALNIIILLLCGTMLFYIIGLGRIICPKTSALSQGEIDGKKDLSKPYVSLYGHYYLIPDIVKNHVDQMQYLNAVAMKDTVLGRDVSAMFYKTDHWAKLCPGLPPPSPGWDVISRNVPADATNVWMFHRGKNKAGQLINYVAQMAYMLKGPIARDMAFIQSRIADDPTRTFILRAYDKVYDVSTYMEPINRANFLGDNMRSIIYTLGQTTKDATSFIEQIKQIEGVQQWRQYMTCLDNTFFVGVVDHRLSPQCLFSNYILLISSILLVVIIGFKFIAALQFSSKGNPEIRDKYVLCCVPCYSENADSLRLTIDSIATSQFDHRRKLIFIIADGIVIGAGNTQSTPEILLDVFGAADRNLDPNVNSHMFLSIGEGKEQINRAKVFSGVYNKQGTNTPYVVVVKVGKPEETRRAGNRGKRDSQLLLMRFLGRMHGREPMCDLEIELFRHFTQVIGVHPCQYEYLLWVDADTEVYPDSINHLVSIMVGDSTVAGICGETILRNENDSWVTMIQIYEYFISHHLSKAFESFFGSVTCLPGCFCMYRVFSPSSNLPLVVAPGVIADYGENRVDTLHMKNLLTLGEDRYLTTLMLKHFPKFKLKFTPDARARTDAPNTWAVLISQRRRWINSTVHNLLELMQLRNLCGFCVFSMRFVVFLELFSNVVQPAGFIYVVYLIVSLVTDSDAQIPLISILMIASIYGLQVVIFVIKREWQHIGWMLIYILAMPLYAFYLPLYAFWHFDDFSWGETRVVVDEQSGEQMLEKDMDAFDIPTIPMRKLDEIDAPWSDTQVYAPDHQEGKKRDDFAVQVVDIKTSLNADEHVDHDSDGDDDEIVGDWFVTTNTKPSNK